MFTLASEILQCLRMYQFKLLRGNFFNMRPLCRETVLVTQKDADEASLLVIYE